MLHEQRVAEITHNCHMTGGQPISLAELKLRLLQMDPLRVLLADVIISSDRWREDERW